MEMRSSLLLGVTKLGGRKARDADGHLCHHKMPAKKKAKQRRAGPKDSDKTASTLKPLDLAIPRRSILNMLITCVIDM